MSHGQRRRQFAGVFDGDVVAVAQREIERRFTAAENPHVVPRVVGTYVLEPSVLGRIAEGRRVSVERETFPGLLEAGARVSGHVDAAYWRDLGTPLDLVKGSADLVRGVVAHQKEVDVAVEGLLTLLEPLMIAVLGGIIGSMIIARR